MFRLRKTDSSGAICANPDDTQSVGGRRGFRLFWTWKIRRGKRGRPSVPQEVRELVRNMSRENPLWGAPRIRGELLKLGIDIGRDECKEVPRARQETTIPDLEDFPGETIDRHDLYLPLRFQGARIELSFSTGAAVLETDNAIGTSSTILR